MNLVSKELLKKIDESKRKLDNSKVPMFIGAMFENLTTSVIENASIQDADNKFRREEVISNFNDGWSYAQEAYPKNFDLVYLSEIAGRVEPSFREPLSSYARYRDGFAMLRGLAMPPSDKGRILAHLNRTIDSIEKSSFHPLEEAMFLYFHLIRIQPFSNGNKRTANIVMNTKLNKEGFLPISIKPKDNSTFLDYLHGAIGGFNELSSSLDDPLRAYTNPEVFQRQLYDFLAKKELNSLLCAENVMAGLNRYSVNVLKGDRGEVYKLKHLLDSYFRSRQQIGQVRTDGRRELDITGNIPLQTLERILNEGVGGKKVKILERN